MFSRQITFQINHFEIGLLVGHNVLATALALWYNVYCCIHSCFKDLISFAKKTIRLGISERTLVRLATLVEYCFLSYASSTNTVHHALYEMFMRRMQSVKYKTMKCDKFRYFFLSEQENPEFTQ